MVWLSITVVAAVAVVRVTEKMHHRAVAQTSADAIAMAAVQYGELTARHFAGVLGVKRLQFRTDAGVVTAYGWLGNTHFVSSACCLRNS